MNVNIWLKWAQGPSRTWVQVGCRPKKAQGPSGTQLGPSGTWAKVGRQALLSCAACHTVVRAGDRLTRPEITALLEQMDRIDFGAHCPHGRPVFVEYSAATLAKMFHRT